MASPSEYRDKWLKNRALADKSASALGRDHADWEIVFRFYACVHLVEGLMRTKAERFWSDSHEKRKKAMKSSTELRRATEAYLDLQDLSRDVRYDPGFSIKDSHFDRAKRLAEQVEKIIGPKLNRHVGRSDDAGLDQASGE